MIDDSVHPLEYPLSSAVSPWVQVCFWNPNAIQTDSVASGSSLLVLFCLLGILTL